MITALLLAAGASRRFGAPKLLQDLNGKPVVRWSAESLAGAPISEIVVVVGPPPDGDGVRAALDGVAARFVVNPHPELGIASSLACGVSAVDPASQAAVVALGDEPMVGRDALLRVVERYREGGVSIAAATYGGVRGHPVLFDRTVFDELRTFSGDSGARAAVSRDPARVAFVEVGASYPDDIDTPEDLARLRVSGGAKLTLLDQLMPQFDVSASYATEVRAPVDVVYRAVMETDLASSFATRVLMTVRSLGRRSVSPFRLRDLPPKGAYFALGEDPPREVVAGVVGRFWSLTRNTMEGNRESFRGLPPAGTAKAVLAFRVEPSDGGSRVTTETRVLCADAASRLRFRLYWAVISPFSGVIRKSALRLIRQRAQYMSTSNPAAS